MNVFIIINYFYFLKGFMILSDCFNKDPDSMKIKDHLS